MANGGGPSTAPAGGGGPRAAQAQQAHQNEAVQSKKDLTSWWRNFKRSDKKAQGVPQVTQGIFGVPLQTSIRYANVAISLYNEEGQSYIYGYVPIVVAKCGVYLKEKATDVEGIFRLAGSEKRIKELKVAFDSPDRFGKGLDWTGYTVHDAANILRRYFNQLPEPIIPLGFYEQFREPLRNHQAEAVGTMDAQSPSEGTFDQGNAIRAYQALITELPPLNRQLLLYILDLLAVFASKSDLNKMTTPNLAAIFQPGILSHPQHDMAPQEYRLSQDVLIFLIENQDSFLIGMPGTAADTQTVKDVQSGTPVKTPTTPTTPGRSKTIIGRSSSTATTASAAAESVRKFGSLRRNASVSSKNSKKSQVEGGPTPVVGSPATPSGSGVHRSNTVPSRRPGTGAPSPRFPRERGSGPSTPNAGGAGSLDEMQGSIQSTPISTQAPIFPPPVPTTQIQSPASSEATTPLAQIGSETSSAVTQDYSTPKKDTTPLLSPPGASGEQQRERQVSGTPSTSSTKGFLDTFFKQSPTSGDESQRKPNKLQKRRIPSSAISSAQSSSQSLPMDGTAEHPQRSPVNPAFAPDDASDPVWADGQRGTPPGAQSNYATAQSTPMQSITPQRMPTDATLRPAVSPTQSYTSHTDTTDISDAEMGGDETPMHSPQQIGREKKKQHRWRFSRSQNKLDQPPQSPSHPFGQKQEHATSRSTIGSSTGEPAPHRRSFQAPVPLNPSATDPTAGAPISSQSLQSSSTDPAVFSDSERERKGPMSWIRGKLQDRKDKDAEKRARTPDRNRERNESKADLHPPQFQNLPVRGPSFDQQGQGSRQGSGQMLAAPAQIGGHQPGGPVGTTTQHADSAPAAAGLLLQQQQLSAPVSAVPTANEQQPPRASQDYAPSPFIRTGPSKPVPEQSKVGRLDGVGSEQNGDTMMTPQQQP